MNSIEIDPVIDEYMEKVDVKNKTRIYWPVHIQSDICDELKRCIVCDGYDIENLICIEGYTAKDIAELAPFMNYLGVYNFLVVLRMDSEKAKNIIAQGFPRK